MPKLGITLSDFLLQLRNTRYSKLS